MATVPGWMRALAAVCALTLAIAVSSDLFVPDARRGEVWFGFELTGTRALLTAPLHWSATQDLLGRGTDARVRRLRHARPSCRGWRSHHGMRGTHRGAPA